MLVCKSEYVVDEGQDVAVGHCCPIASRTGGTPARSLAECVCVWVNGELREGSDDVGGMEPTRRGETVPCTKQKGSHAHTHTSGGIGPSRTLPLEEVVLRHEIYGCGIGGLQHAHTRTILSS